MGAPMTSQEVFDTVAQHLFAQGKQSFDRSGACLYRGPKGLKCAIGALIPDAEYHGSFEATGLEELSARVSCLSGHKPDFLHDLQQAHDDDHNWDTDETMRDALGLVAGRYSLDASILANLSFPDPTP